MIALAEAFVRNEDLKEGILQMDQYHKARSVPRDAPALHASHMLSPAPHIVSVPSSAEIQSVVTDVLGRLRVWQMS